MKKLLLWLDEKFEETILNILLAGIVISMSVHVFFRYVLKSPLTFTEELSRYLFIWFVFMGISYGIKESIHIRVNIIEEFFPKVTPIFSFVQDLVITIVVLYLIPAGINVTKFFLKTNQTSPGLEINMVFIYGSFMLALFLSLIRIIQRWVHRICNFRKNRTQSNLKEGEVN